METLVDRITTITLSLDKVRSLYESNHSLSEKNVFLTYTVGTVGSSGNVRKAIGGRKLMKAKISAKDDSLIWFYRCFDLTIRSIKLKIWFYQFFDLTTPSIKLK